MKSAEIFLLLRRAIRRAHSRSKKISAPLGGLIFVWEIRIDPKLFLCSFLIFFFVLLNFLGLRIN